MPGPQLIFLYGTLMRPFPAQARLGVEHMLEYLGRDAVAGQLYDVGPYPALRPGSARVWGQVFVVHEKQVIDILDEFEIYRPGRPEESEYLRELWPLLERPAEAWVYVFNRSVEGLPLIQSGDWAAHQAREDAAPTPWDDFFSSREVQ